MPIVLKTVKEMVERSGGFYTYYKPELHEYKWPKMNGHDKAIWMEALVRLSDVVSSAGYFNPTYIYWNKVVSIAVDEHPGIYGEWPKSRPSVHDLADHVGLGIGCSCGNKTQLITLEMFFRPGGWFRKPHGDGSWIPGQHCKECWPWEK